MISTIKVGSAFAGLWVGIASLSGRSSSVLDTPGGVQLHRRVVFHASRLMILEHDHPDYNAHKTAPTSKSNISF